MNDAEIKQQPADPSPPAPLTDIEKARLAELRGLNPGQLSVAEYAEMDALAAREGLVAPDPYLDRTTAAAHATGLSAAVNQPPPAPPPRPQSSPQETMFQHLFGAVEHLLSGMSHLSQTVPAAAGLVPLLQAAGSRLGAARADFETMVRGGAEPETGPAGYETEPQQDHSSEPKPAG